MSDNLKKDVGALGLVLIPVVCIALAVVVGAIWEKQKSSVKLIPEGNAEVLKIKKWNREGRCSYEVFFSISPDKTLYISCSEELKVGDKISVLSKCGKGGCSYRYAGKASAKEG